MTRRKYLQAAAGLISTSLAFGALAQPLNAPAAKVVFQISGSDAASWNLALNNVKNVQHELGAAHVQIEMVVYGPGIGMVRDDALSANRVTEAVQSGVQILVCENTMTGLQLTPADMHPLVGYVKAGVVQLMKRQAEGWAYIRP